MAEAVVETPTQTSPIAQIVEVMMSRIEAAGIATADQIGIGTLADRLTAEALTSGATGIGEMMFGAIARAA